MGLRRRIHFSFHDTRCLMTLEPFNINDKGVFVNPVTIEVHRCQVQLPINDLRYVSEQSINDHALGHCNAHTCCVAWIIDQMCSECSKNSSIIDCPFFMVCNEYVPYESLMSDLNTAPLSSSTVSPTWIADMPQYPEVFYPGHRFDERAHINGADVDDSRKAMFSASRDILVARRDLERRIRHRRECFNRISTAKAVSCKIWCSQIHSRVSDLQSDIKAAKKLASVSAEALAHARRLLEASRIPPSNATFGESNQERPLVKELERLTTCWTELLRNGKS
ncbi:hypothetical protein F5Y05DRAFT_118864 [Hypoxylon sp. FL0543]|nr:hypothetical protein F5Y05DRAFT_118864 [Hypoxylon sp. FL0543]